MVKKIEDKVDERLTKIEFQEAQRKNEYNKSIK